MEKSVKDVLIERGKQYDELNAKIRQLESRISELEAACVMGGDGNPIIIGERYYFRDGYGVLKPINALTIDVQEYGYILVNDRKHECEPSDLYSYPEDVPEGGK